MSVTLAPYLNFPAGVTREAMTYYQSIFGGRLEISTFGEFGLAEAPADGVMHAQLTTDTFTAMASDAMPGAEGTWGGTRVYLAFFGDELEVMTRWYEQLAADGQVGQPLEKQVWGDAYGLVTDKFGLEWMFNIAIPEGWAQTGSA